MANEVQVQLSFRASKGGATISFQDNFRQDMAGDDLTNQTQLIGTGTAELVDFGEISAPYTQIIIKNLDPTNYVVIYSSAAETGLGLKIPAGKFALFSTDDQPIYAKADGAAVRILTLAS